MNECSKQLNTSIQKEEFNCFVLKKKYEQLLEQQQSKPSENEMNQRHMKSRKVMCINEEFGGEEDIVTDEDFLFEKKMTKEEELNERKIKENQKQNEIIEKAFPILHEWSGKNEVEMIFDSDINLDNNTDKDNEIKDNDDLQNKLSLENIEDLFIFIFEENGNVFGWYLPEGIEENGIINECWLMKENKEVHELKELENYYCQYNQLNEVLTINPMKTNDDNEIREKENIIYFSNKSKKQSIFKSQIIEIKRIMILQMKMDDCLDVINENLSQLKEWSGLNQAVILFDSQEDGEENEQLQENCIGEDNIFFVCIDEIGNVFGVYINDTIKKETELNSKNHFLFAFDNTDDLTGMSQRWYMKNERNGIFELLDENGLFSCGSKDTPMGMVVLSKSEFAMSYCYCLSNVYENLDDVDLNGTAYNEKQNDTFAIQRLIVIKMQ